MSLVKQSRFGRLAGLASFDPDGTRVELMEPYTIDEPRLMVGAMAGG